MKLYFALDDQVAHILPDNRCGDNKRMLADIILATIAVERNDCAMKRHMRELRGVLERARTFDSVPLEDLMPRGDPFFKNTGYYGADGRGLGVVDVNMPDKRRSYLMSESFVGSCSNSYTPLLNVTRRRDIANVTDFPESLPRFMISCEEGYVAAEYDLETGSFKAVGQQKIDPNPMILVSRLMHVDKYVKETEVGDLLQHLHVYISSDRKLRLKRGEAEKSPAKAFFRQRLRKAVYATLSEVEDAIDRINALDHTINHRLLLNSFLLYKAFENAANKKGSYIVGKIEGDSQTMALPYVAVALKYNLKRANFSEF